MKVSGCLYERHDGHERLWLSCKCASVKAARGFTLLEILLAMALTGFGILGLAGLLHVMGNVDAEDTWVTKALFCAQETVEELKFEVVTETDSAREGEESMTDGSYRGMSRKWTVRSSPDLDGLQEIRVECSYPWKGKTKTIRLSTLAYNNR